MNAYYISSRDLTPAQIAVLPKLPKAAALSVTGFSGWHGHAAIKCLQAGYPENAVSWMLRDIGEQNPDFVGEIDPASLRLVRLHGGAAIVWEFKPGPPCLGEGI